MMTPSNPILHSSTHSSSSSKQRLPLAFDPAGLVLALGAADGIHLFDRRNVDLVRLSHAYSYFPCLIIDTSAFRVHL
jgi:hypothetical protein